MLSRGKVENPNKGPLQFPICPYYLWMIYLHLLGASSLFQFHTLYKNIIKSTLQKFALRLFSFFAFVFSTSLSKAMAEDLALDLEELRHLQSIAKRPRSISLLSSEINNLEKLSKGTPSALPAQIPAPISTGTKAPSIPVLKYATLSSFSWDQDNDKVKIYVSLEGVEENKIETEFKPMSFDVKFHDIQGKNYRCAIPKLHGEIVPEKCKVLVKPTRVIITLVKASKGNWLDIHHKEDKMKPNLDKEKDPMAGIMDLMKNMYEEGDEEMKRTIAKAWTDARSGKTADPLKGYN